LLTVDTRKEISKVKIFNMQGKCLQVIKTGEFPLNINFSGFGPGIYIIQLISIQNQYYHEKIIKAN
ncbi:MAG: T9SS type A sorting domain-containing protein, partial [Chitinophagaceae bacterium]|nr:T9SS type A sorting domain-containing protein [Chitinophagaceae bacterium]